MTWTYGNNPATITRDEIRFDIGDTNTLDQLLSDEEIAFVIADESTLDRAKARCCDAIVAKLSKMVDFSTGGLTVSLGARVEAYRKLAQDFRDRYVSVAAPIVGGISVDDKETEESDSDRVEPAFTRGTGRGVDSNGGTVQDWRNL